LEPSVASGPAEARTKAVELSPEAVELLGRWRSLVESIAEDRPEVASILSHVVPLELADDRYLLGVEKGSVFESRATSPEAMAQIQGASTKLFGTTPDVGFKINGAHPGGMTLASQKAAERAEAEAEAIRRAKQHPRVLDAIEILGAKVKEVRLAKS
jgi:hypothetical protein